MRLDQNTKKIRRPKKPEKITEPQSSKKVTSKDMIPCVVFPLERKLRWLCTPTLQEEGGSLHICTAGNVVCPWMDVRT